MGKEALSGANFRKEISTTNSFLFFFDIVITN